jgi:hypothetical protein
VSTEDEEWVGSDASRTVLYAQVRDGQPKMVIDEDGYLRPKGWPDSGGKVYLGDVAHLCVQHGTTCIRADPLLILCTHNLLCV